MSWPRASLQTYLVGMILAAAVPLVFLLCWLLARDIRLQHAQRDDMLAVRAWSAAQLIDHDIARTVVHPRDPADSGLQPDDDSAVTLDVFKHVQLHTDGLPAGSVAVLCDAAGRMVAPAPISSSSPTRCEDLADDAHQVAWQPLSRGAWQIGIVMPIAAIDAMQRRAVLITVGSAALCLLLGGAGASLLARQIAEPLRRLARGDAASPAQAPIAIDEIAQLREVTEQMRTWAQEFEALFHQSPVGLAFARDRDCQSVLCNAVLEQLAPHALAWRDDQQPTERAGQVFFAGAPLPPQERPLRRAAISGLNAEAVELELRVPGSPARFVLASAVALLDAKQQPRGAIGAMVDITAQRNAEIENAAAVQRAQRMRRDTDVDLANKAKDEFLGMLGHELRNPLNAIATAAEVLNRSEASAAVALSARNIIVKQTQQLARMMDAMLDVGRVLCNDVQLVRQPIDFAALVQRVAAAAESGAAQRRLSIAQRIGPAWVHADLQRLQQAVEQLVSNAVKLTPDGGQVDLRLALDAGDAVLRVRDTRIGSEPALARIFESFAQGSCSPAQPGAQLGIGLGVVRRLVELHGGQVSVVSGAGDSEFMLRIPAIAPPATLAGTAG